MTFFQILGRLFLSLKRGLDSKWATNYLGCKSNSLFFENLTLGTFLCSDHDFYLYMVPL